MEIRVLKYFLAIAREGSVTKAANILHVTQPTLSRQMQDLEYELKISLFNRDKHELKLTQEGMLFVQRAEEIVSLVEKTTTEFKNLKDEISGDIYLGCGETQTFSEIAEIIAKIKKEHPKVTFHIHSANGIEVKDKINKGLLDFGLIIEPSNIDSYESICLKRRDVWGIFMPTSYPLANNDKDYVELADIKDVPIIISKQLHKDSEIYLDEEGEKFFPNGFADLKVVCYYNLIFNATLLLEQGLGVVLGLGGLTNNPNIVFKPIAPKIESKVHVIWNKDRVLTPLQKLFIEELRLSIEKK